ncbi:MAG: 50S ribosomal protein L1, partial [Fulvivirga sp.]
KIKDTVRELLQTVSKLKPASAKGTYFKSINISSTMSPSITIDKSTISGLQ